MIRELMETNREVIARLGKWAIAIGWILLAVMVVMLLPVANQCCQTLSVQSFFSVTILRIINPAFFALLFLVIGQFLSFTLEPHEQQGWFLRNGCMIFRIYAAVVVGGIIVGLALGIISAVQRSDVSLWLILNPLVLVSGVAKVLLLWGAATILRIMMDDMQNEITNETE